jgi:hypothetical protein
LLKEAGPLLEIGGSRPDIFDRLDGVFDRLDGVSSHQLGRVSVSDNEWWNCAMDLIIHSTAIFISPNDTKSLIKEIELIFSDNRLLRRAFLIMEPGVLMPPRRYGFNLFGMTVRGFRAGDRDAVMDRHERWERTRAFFRERGSDLPGYMDAGAIVSLYDPRKHTAFSGLSRYRLYDLLQSMAVDLTKRGSYDIQETKLCPCVESKRQFSDCHGGRETLQRLQGVIAPSTANSNSRSAAAPRRRSRLARFLGRQTSPA